ncbi:LysR family transcriptional regulator [Gemmobacter sp.]|uniref:LysR family transcriptional regulator n=1 Tax=Gemmobacter sp. TaxID=1898957 RepID=UPI002AFFE71B|nr:LysR family transcriptional regulator [Gemmobacter sp.]
MLDTDIALADLRVVLAVAETASYTRASHKLNISQPAVSRRIGALEQRLGLRLFRREGQRFFLTEAGTVFCEQAGEILERMAQLESSTIGQSATPKGSVALGVPPSTGEVIVRAVVPAYRKAYPDVSMRIEQGYVADLFEMLMDKRIDVALLNGEFNSNDVYLERLFDHHLGIVYPAAWQKTSPLGGKPMPDQLTIAQVAQLPLLLPSRNQSLRHLVDEAFRKAGVEPLVDLEVNSFVLQKSLALAGHGCLFMSPTAIRDADAGKLCFVPISDADLVYTLYLATRQFGQPTLACRMLEKMIRKHAGKIESWLTNSSMLP